MVNKSIGFGITSPQVGTTPAQSHAHGPLTDGDGGDRNAVEHAAEESAAPEKPPLPQPRCHS